MNKTLNNHFWVVYNKKGIIKAIRTKKYLAIDDVLSVSKYRHTSSTIYEGWQCLVKDGWKVLKSKITPLDAHCHHRDKNKSIVLTLSEGGIIKRENNTEPKYCILTEKQCSKLAFELSNTYGKVIPYVHEGLYNGMMIINIDADNVINLTT